jgi:uncharacterized coiled-coil DUF342 family protein
VTDIAIKNAVERHDSLAKQINELNQQLEDARRELAKVAQFISLWKEFSGEAVEAPSIAPIRNRIRIIRKVGEAVEKPVNPSKERIGEVLEAFLKKLQRPASRRELQAHLREVGIHLQGTDPDMVLSTMLWRMQGKFKRHPPHGYWLTDVPLPVSTGLTDIL